MILEVKTGGRASGLGSRSVPDPAEEGLGRESQAVSLALVGRYWLVRA